MGESGIGADERSIRYPHSERHETVLGPKTPEAALVGVAVAFVGVVEMPGRRSRSGGVKLLGSGLTVMVVVVVEMYVVDVSELSWSWVLLLLLLHCRSRS